MGVVCALHCTHFSRCSAGPHQSCHAMPRSRPSSCNPPREGQLPACLPSHNTLRGACTCACAWGLCLSVSAPCASVSASRARLSPSRMSSLVAGDMLCLPGTRRYPTTSTHLIGMLGMVVLGGDVVVIRWFARTSVFSKDSDKLGHQQPEIPTATLSPVDGMLRHGELPARSANLRRHSGWCISPQVH